VRKIFPRIFSKNEKDLSLKTKQFFIDLTMLTTVQGNLTIKLTSD